MKHFIYLFIFGWTFFGFSQDLEQKKEKANDSIKQVENFHQELKKELLTTFTYFGMSY